MGVPILRSSAIAIILTLCGPWIPIRTVDNPLPFDVDEWLQYKKHKDFSWDVRVSKPSLTIQQRFLVSVSATVNCSDLPASERDHDLRFVLKVADEDNVWIPGYSETRLTVYSGLGKNNYINVVAGVYLRPGRYTLALIVYDSVTHKGNVQKKKIKVPRPKGDLLPEMDRTLSKVEFTTEAPLNRYRDAYFIGGYNYAFSYEPLAAGREWLPVKNSRRICLDIVANISQGTYGNTKEFGRDYAYPFSVLQVASVLSHLGLENGSIHVSILDTLGVKTYFYRRNASNIDWRQTGQAILYRGDPEIVDYGELKAQTEASAFLVDTLHKIMGENACTPDSESPLKIILIVSGELKFAERTPIHQLIQPDLLKNPVPVKVFHFRVHSYFASGDDLGSMLEPAKPQDFTFTDANSFRESLADFISLLEEL